MTTRFFLQSQHMLIAKIKQTIKKYSMLNPGERVLVAVSGGPDSVCLLSALHALSRELDISLHIAHLDHMFRGKESAGEALFVAELANRLGIPASIERFNVPLFCRERGLSPQEGARTARYAFLRRTAEATQSSRIATGHTADDQAETVLMRLIRGAGLSGLSSIPPVRENIIRPLIESTREDVMEHLSASGLEFRTDPSNAKPLYTRNRIRLELIPVLKRFNPRVVETLASEAALLREENEAVEAYLTDIMTGIMNRDGEAVVLNRSGFNTLPTAFRRRLLRKIANLTGVESSTLPLDRIDDALTFMSAAQTGRTMELHRGLSIGREYDRFVFSSKTEVEGFSRILSIPGTTTIPEAGLDVETRIHAASDGPEKDTDVTFPETGSEPSIDGGNYFWRALFDYDKIGSFLTLRSRRPGDRFYPSGMGGGSKKLQDYFVDEKVPRRKRDTVPLLCSGENLLWVVGMRTDERFLPRGDAKKALIVTVRKTLS